MVSLRTKAAARPLCGEPLALDLVNTEWVEAGVRRDLLTCDAGTEDWLRANRLALPERALLSEARRHLLTVRAALRALLENDDPARGVDALNRVLARGCVRHRLGADGPLEEVEVAAAWRPAWLAAFDYLELKRRWPDWRIKACAHPECILYFLDTSRNGTRRWCDMRTCGNRFNVRRHYHRHKGGCDGPA